MKVKEAYNIWADRYDTNENKTRDLEAISLRRTLDDIHFESCLEIGCGTGKNTEWLITKAKYILSIDLSEKMLEKARAKILSDRVHFVQADITTSWDFVADHKFDLITFSLVLEHIENLDSVFGNLNKIIASNGYVYIGELHPFKQYTGSKARFETEGRLNIVTCFDHHISDFTNTAMRHGFQISDLTEYFDNGDRTAIPRILTLLLRK